MKELIEKMKKYSAKQLVEKLEKGKVDEAEKNAIISELRRKGRDVTPYVGEPVTEEGELVNQPGDAENLAADNETGLSVSERLKKQKEQEKKSAVDSGSSAPQKRIRVNFQSEEFPKGSLVQIEGATTLMEDKAKGIVKSAFYWEGKPENWYLVITPEDGGKNFSKSYKGITLISLPEEVKEKESVEQETKTENAE